MVGSEQDPLNDPIVAELLGITSEQDQRGALHPVDEHAASPELAKGFVAWIKHMDEVEEVDYERFIEDEKVDEEEAALIRAGVPVTEYISPSKLFRIARSRMPEKTFREYFTPRAKETDDEHVLPYEDEPFAIKTFLAIGDHASEELLGFNSRGSLDPDRNSDWPDYRLGNNIVIFQAGEDARQKPFHFDDDVVNPKTGSEFTGYESDFTHIRTHPKFGVRIVAAQRRRGIDLVYGASGSIAGLAIFTVTRDASRVNILDLKERELALFMKTRGLVAEFGNRRMTIRLRKDNKRAGITLRRNNQIEDGWTFPTRMTTRGITIKLIPDPLLKNPLIPNTEIDNLWSKTPLLPAVGVRWT